uniref:ornithine decarboxylase n=1 Tax=Paramoeba aestuarina TaxID=180227 RepID=A0A7S4L4P9_9EUKA|mmetsp:Transcript_31390/g.49025  ORF Transcript_31390/g.49025 Transcript_31390/m.49025 type:complete len:502 (+) Transcript_31390:223-1728(+)
MSLDAEPTFEMEMEDDKGKQEEEEKVVSEDDSILSSSDYETREGLRLMLSFDPVSSRPVVQVQPQNVQKPKRRKRSKEKKKAYDKVKSKNSQAANQKAYKANQKKAKKLEKKPGEKEEGESKNARKKRLLRGNAHGVEVVNADEVMDKRFEEDSEELMVRDLQKKVQNVLREEGTEVQVVPDSSLLEDLLTKKVKDNVHNDDDEEASPAFFLLDLGTVVRKYVQWLSCFPRIKPYYAVKCNPDGVIVKTINTCGGGFDCASVPEIKLALSQGAKPEDIIFANPSKPKKAIEYSKKVGVAKMTFDNVTELQKIHELYPESECVLRILGDDTYSLMAFGSKFGCTVPEESTKILEKAKELKANVVGISFHVGSWCTSSKAFIKTLELAKSVFETAKSLGINFTLLDIGGGWPGFDTEDLSFREIAAPIRQAIDEMFDESITIIAEPGRYFVTECAVLATSIIARRERVKQPNDPRIVERTDTPLHEQQAAKEKEKEKESFQNG